METAVDVVESVLYQTALDGNVVAMIFYLKSHRKCLRRVAYVPLATEWAAIRADVVAGASARFHGLGDCRLLAFVLLLSFALLLTNSSLAAHR